MHPAYHQVLQHQPTNEQHLLVSDLSHLKFCLHYSTQQERNKVRLHFSFKKKTSFVYMRFVIIYDVGRCTVLHPTTISNLTNAF